MVYILDSMEELKMRLLSDDYGKHLLGVEDLLQKHSLVEADINVLGERVKQVVMHSHRFLEEETVQDYQPCDPSIIVERVSGKKFTQWVSLVIGCVIHTDVPTLEFWALERLSMTFFEYILFATLFSSNGKGFSEKIEKSRNVLDLWLHSVMNCDFVAQF